MLLISIGFVAWTTLLIALFLQAPASWLFLAAGAGAIVWAALPRIFPKQCSDAACRLRNIFFSKGAALLPIFCAVAAVIVFFAALYFALCVSEKKYGDIILVATGSEHFSISQDVLNRPGEQRTEYRVTPAGNSLLARRCLYFSSTTFCSLSYGDYQPVGRAQWLAAAEALIGFACAAWLAGTIAARLLRMLTLDRGGVV